MTIATPPEAQTTPNEGSAQTKLPEVGPSRSDLLEGMITSIGESGIRGWVWNRQEPYRALSVELYANNELLELALADQFEMELIDREIGNGKHAFIIRVGVWPDLPLPVKMEVRVAGTSHVLGQFEVQGLSDIEGLATTAPVGNVDGVIDGEVKGWAFDRANPKTNFAVDLRIDGEIVDTIPCTGFRRDLKAAGYVDGNCAFSFPLPHTLLDGKTHSIRVCYAGTEVDLPNGVMLYGLTSQNSLTRYISELNKTIKQFETELAGTEKRLLERHEALLTIQRENMERELQAVRKLIIENQMATSKPELEKPLSKKPVAIKRTISK